MSLHLNTIVLILGPAQSFRRTRFKHDSWPLQGAHGAASSKSTCPPHPPKSSKPTGEIMRHAYSIHNTAMAELPCARRLRHDEQRHGAIRNHRPCPRRFNDAACPRHDRPSLEGSRDRRGPRRSRRAVRHSDPPEICPRSCLFWFLVQLVGPSAALDEGPRRRCSSPDPAAGHLRRRGFFEHADHPGPAGTRNSQLSTGNRSVSRMARFTPEKGE